MQAHGFRVFFTPLIEVLFTFPSRYSSTIGLSVVFSLTGWAPLIHAEFLVLRATQVPTRRQRTDFAYGALTLYGPTFQPVPLSLRDILFAGPITPRAATYATAAVWALPRSLATTCGIILIFSSCGYLDVSVPRVRPARLARAVHGSLHVGSPIRTSAHLRLFAPTRGFSQLITSFVASESHRHPPCALVRFPFFASADLSPPSLTPHRGQERRRSIVSVLLLLFSAASSLGGNAFTRLPTARMPPVSCQNVNDLFSCFFLL